MINTEDYKIDLRYFPHYQNIEFYSEDTDGCPWYIENIGDVVIFARTSAGTIKLEGTLLTLDNFSTYRNGRPIGDERFVWIDTVEKKWKFVEE